MSKIAYTKPSLSYEEQLSQLKSRGLLITNEKKTLHLLEVLSYYRLSGYWFPMLAHPKKNHIFKTDSNFENAFQLYCFDRELRQIVMSELEKIEIAVRAKMIFILSQEHGAFWFQNSVLFINPLVFASTISKMGNEFNRSDEQFIKSFKKTYNDPLPPGWMATEISSFGNLSYLFQNLKPLPSKRSIANFFGLDESTFASWLHCIVYVRNICAHHARLWNRDLRITPKIPINPANNWLKVISSQHSITKKEYLLNSKIYFFLSMIQYFLNTVSPENAFQNKIKRLFSNFAAVDKKAMGFPIGWELETLWKDKTCAN